MGLYMKNDKPNPKQNDKTTQADSIKNFSHERPAPDTNPPIINPIQVNPPDVEQTPNQGTQSTQSNSPKNQESSD